MTAGDVITIRGNAHARKACCFDGTDDYILADAHAVARVAANDTAGTYSAWVNLDASTSTKTLLSAGDNNSATEYLQIYFTGTTNKLIVKLYHGGATKFQVEQTTGSIVSGQWTHVAVVQNGTQPTLYINGQTVTQSNTAAVDLTYWYDQLTGCDKFAIGVLESNATHTFGYAGMISDVKYWSKALTAAEVLSDYKGTALSDNGTYLQFHLLKDLGAPLASLVDQGLGADNGTLTGNAYLCGWGSQWSRNLDLSGAVVADQITTHRDGNIVTTTIIKAA